MSPEAEAHKIIAISFGKIANSRVQRGGPKLCKNLLVANLIHKARTLYDEQVHCFQPKCVQSVAPASFENPDSVQSQDEVKTDMTEVPCEDDEMLPSAHKDYQTEDLKRGSVQTVNECDDKENDSPDVSSDAGDISRLQTGSRTRPDLNTMLKSRAIPSRCLKRRNCSEGKGDYETHRSPSKRLCDRRSRRRSSSADALDSLPLAQESYDSDSGLSTEVMDVEQISSLVSAFSNSLKDFSYVSCVTKDSENVTVPDKPVQTSLWRSNSVPDMVLCAQQVTSVLKMRQQGFETSTPVVA